MRVAVALVVVVVFVFVGGCGKQKKQPVVVVDAGHDSGVVDGGVDGGVVDGGVVDGGVVDGGVVDGGVVDGGVDGVVDGGVDVDVVADAGVAVVEEEGCGLERKTMRELVTLAKTNATQALSSSKPLWGTGVCRMDTAVRYGRAEILREVAKATADPAAKKELLTESAELKPAFSTLLLLGDACDAVNDLDGAIDAWQRALPLSAGGTQRAVEAKIARIEQKRAVEAKFESRANLHFVARYEGDERKDLADTALTILEDARAKLERSLGAVPPAPITVVLYTGDQYAKASSGPDWSGGVFDGKIRIKESQLKAARGDLEDVLFHEYLHALLRTAVGRPVPSWFNEGLAQWVEPDDDKAKIAARMQQKKQAELPSLASLSASFSATSDRKAAGLRYDCAYDLMTELEHWRGAGSFADMFKAMIGGKDFAAAFDDVYGMDLTVFESRWRSKYP